MTPEQFHKLSGLYHAALELEPTRRQSFLQEQCQGDEELQHEISQLLAANNEAASFLAEPAINLSTEIQEPDTAMIGRAFGHYRIISHLGAGGMGEVYLATDEKLGRKVAIKLLPVEFANDPERLRRFVTEAKSASATAHPNIVTIHDIGETDGIHYIAQEFVEGETLRNRIEQGPISPLEAVNIAQQTANALAAAHGSGIVHRDIKPENIMLRHDGFVKLLDFGLAGMNPAEAMSGDQSNAPTLHKNTAPGVIMGTVSYMSPEQTRGQKLDARSDLWSLGVVLYEMLIGERPFHGDSIPDIFVAILERQPIPLAELLDDAPAQLQQILDKLLAKNREQRYQSSAQLVEELKRLHRRLELDAERNIGEVSESATLFITPKPTASPITAAPPSTAEPPTFSTQSLPADAVTKELAQVARLSRVTIGLAALLIVGLIAGAAWWAMQSKTPATVPAITAEQLPERSFNYWLTVQMMRDGKPYREPFESAGKERYESGSKFLFNFISPQTGYLYLINEGPATNGISFWMLFPLPSINQSSAKIEPNDPIKTGWLTFNENTGDEKIWALWSAEPIRELETIKADVLTPQAKGEFRTPQQRDTVRRLLDKLPQSKSADLEDRNNQKTAVTGRGETLIHLVELTHH
jgi:serine/threonine protein kinase